MTDMDKFKRLCIPDWEKEKGIVWVEYHIGPDRIVELQIQQGKN